MSESTQQLMRMHVETLFTHDAKQRLVSTNEPTPKSAPRFFLGRTVQGSVRRFRHDLEDELVEALESACLDEPFGAEFLSPPHGATIYEEILARRESIQKKWTGPAYWFPERLAAPAGTVLVTAENASVLHPYLEAWLGDIATCQPLLARIVDGQAVSVCGSVRTTPIAHEAGVETARDFRDRGFAVQVVSAWAEAVRDAARIPLYSTSWENTASQAVAARLGLIRYGTVLHLT